MSNANIRATENIQNSMAQWFRRQIDQMVEGGPAAVLRKTYKLLGEAIYFVSIPLLLPIVLAIRAIRPIIWIRFGRLRGERFGHFAINTELYLCERAAEPHSKQTLDIFYCTKPISNQQLRKMWGRTMRIFQFASVLDRLNQFVPGFQPHVIRLPVEIDKRSIELLSRFPSSLKFTKEEEKEGWSALRTMGIPRETPFICLATRDSAYLEKQFPGNNWNYHSYRNSSIQNYVLAAEELTERGYFVLRLGAVVDEAIRTSHPMIIDYATNRCRSEFLDLFLGANCSFFLSNTVGVGALAKIFRRPMAMANMIPLEHARSWTANNLIIPKKLWVREHRRFMTFREILESGAGNFQATAQFQRLGIEIVDNTPEEITDLAVEMDETLKGTWQSAREDIELQRRFWSLFNEIVFKSTVTDHSSFPRIGTKFLRQNIELLS